MAIEISAIQSPVVSAIRDQFGSLADARTQLTNAIPQELLNQILPTTSLAQLERMDNKFEAALGVSKALNHDTISGFFAEQNTTTSATTFQAQLLSRSVNVDGAQRLGSVDQTVSSQARVTNPQEIQQATPAVESFTQLLGRLAYQNVQAVALPEPVIFNPSAPKFTDELKEISAPNTTRVAGGLADLAKNFQSFSSIQEVLANFSSVKPLKNIVDDVVSDFSSTSKQESRTSLLV